jgi:hypothetical protein
VTVRRAFDLLITVASVLLAGALAYLHQPRIPAHGKGGVGLLEGSFDRHGPLNFVFTESRFNEMRCGGKDWRGKSRSEAQFVTCKDSAVAAFSPVDLLVDAIVVHFTPTRIQTYDLARFAGGYYLRREIHVERQSPVAAVGILISVAASWLALLGLS